MSENAYRPITILQKELSFLDSYWYDTVTSLELSGACLMSQFNYLKSFNYLIFFFGLILIPLFSDELVSWIVSCEPELELGTG